MVECLRCGKCCFYSFNGKIKKCRFLIFLSNKKTSCRIYKNRLNTEIDKGFYCINRIEDNRIIDGCPYNLNIALRQLPKA